ncbi:MAG: hypothetical protein KC549_12440 [Myxococcales bacterium]|nr:hypothetical protein [Myxococcales bacterium]
MLFPAALDHLDELTLDAAALPELPGLAARWATLKADLGRLEPAQIGAEQVARFAHFALELAEALGPRQLAVAQELGDVLGQALVAAELRQRDVLAHFALRQLGQALHDFYQVVEAFGQLFHELSDDEHQLVLAGVKLADGADLPVETQHIFRAELLITLAIDSLAAPVAQLARWTRAAVGATRTLSASMATEGWAIIGALPGLRMMPDLPMDAA